MFINKFKKSFALILSGLTFCLVSCDPTIEQLEFDLAEAESKEDQSGPTAFFGYAAGIDGDWNKITFANGSTSAISYEWTFGSDIGNLSYDNLSDFNNSQPTFEYTNVLDLQNAGDSKTFEVTLKATDAHGVSSTYTNEISVINNGSPLTIELSDIYDEVTTVSILDYSSWQETKPGQAEPANILDGNATTKWTSSDSGTGDGLDDGEYIIFDLGSVNDLNVFQFTTDNKSDPYGYQVLVSESGTTDDDFTQLYPIETGELAFSDPVLGVDYLDQNIFIDYSARYVKLIVYGRYDILTGAQKSEWNNITTVGFFKNK